MAPPDHVARIMDFDGTLSFNPVKPERSVLEQLALDYMREGVPSHRRRRLRLQLGALLVKRGMKLVDLVMQFNRLFLSDRNRDETELQRYVTGESTKLTAFDVLFLMHAGIPWSFVRDRAEEYAAYIPEHHKRAVRNAHGDLYIISSGVVQQIEAILEAAGIRDCFAGIYGNEFSIRGERIATSGERSIPEGAMVLGLDRDVLRGGSKGKIAHIQRISDRYSLKYTIGNDMADIGFQRYFGKYAGSNIVSYAVPTASDAFKRYVGPDRILPMERFLAL